MLFPRNDPGAAVILDFRGQTWQSLQRLPGIGSPACSGRCGNEVRIRFKFSLPRRRIGPSTVVVAATRSASDTNFLCDNREWFRLQNATTPRLQRFMISGVKLGNRCKIFPRNALGAAVILDFRSRLANRCSTIFVAVKNGPPATVVAATRSADDSNFRCRKGEWFRLLQS